jgi:hypothetical protein
LGNFRDFFSYVNLIKFPIFGEILLDFYIKKLNGKRKKKRKKEKTKQPTNQPTNLVCMCINML